MELTKTTPQAVTPVTPSYAPTFGCGPIGTRVVTGIAGAAFGGHADLPPTAFGADVMRDADLRITRNTSFRPGSRAWSPPV